LFNHFTFIIDNGTFLNLAKHRVGWANIAAAYEKCNLILKEVETNETNNWPIKPKQLGFLPLKHTKTIQSQLKHYNYSQLESIQHRHIKSIPEARIFSQEATSSKPFTLILF